MLRLPAKRIEDVPDKKLEEILFSTPIEEDDIKRYGLAFRPGFFRNYLDENGDKDGYKVYKDKRGRLYFFEKKKQLNEQAVENFQEEYDDTEAALTSTAPKPDKKPIEEKMKDFYFLRFMVCPKFSYS
ncbi:MAG TPA: hypothetical protein VJ461_05070 [Candidatus Nanoarchaeia archaeon]|nr:hypothetical protein [Candidatus Nanoarchaeia archaeon]